jgi:hypothetical protein
VCRDLGLDLHHNRVDRRNAAVFGRGLLGPPVGMARSDCIRDNEFFFAEVKSATDTLGKSQFGFATTGKDCAFLSSWLKFVKWNSKSWPALDGTHPGVPIARRQRQLLAARRESVVRWMQGAARALEGIPASVKDEDAIAGWPVTTSSMLINDNRATSRWLTSCWWRAACCTPRPNGTGVLFHSAGPGARPLGVTRNPWNLRITWANWPHPIRAPPDQPSD